MVRSSEKWLGVVRSGEKWLGVVGVVRSGGSG